MQHRGANRSQPIAPKPKKLSKQYQWTLYLRQILFESRVVNLWLGYDQLCIAVALHRWRHHAAGGAPRDVGRLPRGEKVGIFGPT